MESFLAVLAIMPDSTVPVATSCHGVKKITTSPQNYQTFQAGSYFFRNIYGLMKKIFVAKKITSIGPILSHFGSIFQIFGQIFSPTENFAILFALLLIFYIVSGLALLVYVKSICKLNKLSKMTPILWSKVPFPALERHIRLVPRIFAHSEFSEIWLKYYFFLFSMVHYCIYSIVTNSFGCYFMLVTKQYF